MAKKKSTKPTPIESASAEIVKILVCKCNSCTHWEIVKCKDGFHYLLCKTCDRMDEIDITLHPHQPAHWVKK